MTIPELLDTHLDEIIRIWFEQATYAASAQGLTRDEVIDSLRQYLQSLAQTLRETGAPAPGPREQRIIDVHLSTRLRQGFNLDEVVHEYTFLGESVARRWSQLDPAERPTLSEIGHFFMAMNRAITSAVATFTKHLGEDEQTQKRYLRLLDQIATEALADRQAPLHERLDDVVAVVLAGMKCDTACYRAT